MEASEENTEFPPSFLGFKSQKFFHESSYDRVSGTENDQQSLNYSASVFHLWLLEVAITKHSKDCYSKAITKGGTTRSSQKTHAIFRKTLRWNLPSHNAILHS